MHQDREAAAAVASLSERERQVCALIAEGFTNPEIAQRLYLSVDTVKSHVRSILAKFHVESRGEAGRIFRRITRNG